MIKLDLYEDDFYNQEMWKEVCDSVEVDSETTEHIIFTISKVEVIKNEM